MSLFRSERLLFIFANFLYNIVKDFKSKRSFIMKKNRKAKKWQLYAAIGAASVVVLGAGGILLFRQPSHTAVKDEPNSSCCCQGRKRSHLLFYCQGQ